MDRLVAVLSQVNDPHLRPRLLAFVEGAQSALVDDTIELGLKRADHLAELRRGIRELAVPSRDPDLGPTPTLEAVEYALGLVAIRLDNALGAARSAGWRPARPQLPAELGATVSRAETGGLLTHIAIRLDQLTRQVNSLKQASDAGRGPAEQKGLINLYVNSVRVEANLAKMELRLGERSVDLAALWRAAEALVALTGDFMRAVTALRPRISAQINQAVQAVRTRVAATVSGLRRVAQTVARRQRAAAAPISATPGPPAPVPEDVEAQARDMILAGQAPPAHWRPAIRHLSFNDTALNSLLGLEHLTSLHYLGLARTQIVDLGPLSGPIGLKFLDLDHTPTRDVTALASLTLLETLRLWGTQVSDLAPLARLTSLQSLDLDGTQVSDLAPLARLISLQRLDLSGTQVSDLSALAGLIGLQSLDLSRTPVNDLSVLAGLTGLQSLDLSGTQISDLSGLAGLTGLKHLDLSGTQISDLSVLAGLTGLQYLGLDEGLSIDVSPLANRNNLEIIRLRRPEAAGAAEKQG
jgi:Leucine-rich repeat (LRR) protein